MLVDRRTFLRVGATAAGAWPTLGTGRRASAAPAATSSAAAEPADCDYVVVGSGAGGGPLAARLAEAGHRVVLLEAGGADEPWTYQVPVLHGLATEDEAMRLDYYVRHYADESRQEKDPNYLVEREAGRRGVFYPRARTLGGCTAHYAMIIIRPHDSDWQTIHEATGDASWAPREMDRYFARVERCLYRGDSAGGHGHDGWLPTRFADVVELASDAIGHHDPSIGQIALEAALSRHDHLPFHVWDRPFFPAKERTRTRVDPNDLRFLKRHGTGLVVVPMAIEQSGHRAGARERIQQAQRTGRLEVRTHCQVTGIVFDDRDPLHARGVTYLPGALLYRADRDPRRFGTPTGPAQEVRARREVILSAGAYTTPQLLMLSGIGPRDVLERRDLAIPVRVELPGVGKNLQDRYEVGVVAQARERFRLLDGATFRGPAPGQAGDPLFEQWWSQGAGLYATNGAVVGFIARSSVAEHDEPDLFIFGVPGSFVGYYSGWSQDAVAPPYDKWTWLLLKGHARFRGRVTLRSTDPLDPPLVDFNYFERDANGALTPDAAKDLVAMREGVEIIRNLLRDSTQLRLHPTIMKDVDLDTEAGIDSFVQNRAWGHHASCTCKIGGDGDRGAVLDAAFRVRGVKGLRVVDASVFPRIPGFFPVMSIYMLAEKAADAIIADAARG